MPRPSLRRRRRPGIISSRRCSRRRRSSSWEMTPTWTQLLAERRVQTHDTSKAELTELRAAVERDLKDAAVSQLSDDRRFTIAYGAVLLLTKMVIACAGYRVTGTAHHYTMFQVLPLAMGKEMEGLAAYF